MQAAAGVHRGAPRRGDRSPAPFSKFHQYLRENVSDKSKRARNPKRNHPPPSFLETTRLKEVKPPPHAGTPRSRRAPSLLCRLPPSCLPDVRSIVGGDESDALFRLRWPAALHSVDYASLDVSVCDRLQQYVDAQPSRAGKQGEICVLSGIALVCVVPAFCGFWYFAIRCAFRTT